MLHSSPSPEVQGWLKILHLDRASLENRLGNPPKDQGDEELLALFFTLTE